MASIITATTTSGLTQSADNSGVLQLASGTGNLVTIPAVTGTAMVSGNMPAFSAGGNALQSITTATFTKVAFNTEEFDTNNCYDSTTNYRFTPTVAGYYQVNSTIISSSAALGRILIAIYKNGSVFKYGTNIPNSSQAPICVASNVIYFNGSTDYVETFVYQDSGSALLCGSQDTIKTFSACLMRSA